uniref:Uncharacterized protein n=1 Tax=Megaselia scalaris TaxID=36166 RepID=T1GPR3_MEGSC
MLGILARVCDTPLEQYKHEYLSTFVDSSEFLDGVRSLLKKIFMDTKNKSKKSIGYQISPLELSSKLMTIFKSIFSMNLWNDTIQNLFSVLSERLANSGSKFADLKIEVEKVSSLLERQAHRNLPEDIYPTLEELTTNTELDLKPNIVNGDYVNVENYVDIHANLLREDFLIPLRDLITELKSHENLDSISSNKIYKNNFVERSNNTKNKKGELVLVDFKAGERNESPNHIGVESTWVNPKKLMYGSLLVFSKDLKFESVILAVVSNREIESIQKGYIQIEIVKMYNIGKVFGEEFIMFESDVYFEPYHYTYKVLRSLNEDNFPLANYIVNIERNAHPPTYLESSKLQTYRYNKSCFYPLDHSTYSSINETLKLDSSQSKAYFHALSNKFSLIQGPPGTGKTFMGLKLASTILKNIQDCQVAVICYTNHALDQFLVGLLPLLEECNLSEDCIVRMGNQSKNELLDKYNVKQISDATTITDRRLKACFYQTKNDYMKTFQEFEKLQQEYAAVMEDIIKVQRTLRKISRKLDELKQISDFNTIKDKRVIAMTTTYASRQNILLQLLATPIVIIEEAAEVLESHIVASLNKNVQHLIMIGDHMQLRPTTSVYKLSQKFNMNISLFERMTRGNGRNSPTKSFEKTNSLIVQPRTEL